MRLAILFLVTGILFVQQALAGNADVVDAKAIKSGNGTWTFRVTVKHADEGWDHYADKWEVVAADGSVLATRVLAHPHVAEQPFTRSKSGIEIPAAVTVVTVRAGDKVHGLGGKEITLTLKK